MKNFIAHYRSHRSWLSILFFVFTAFAVCLMPALGRCQNVSGDWAGTVTVGSNTTSISFTLSQEGTVVTGTAPRSSEGTILGDIQGANFTFRIGYTDLAYSVDITATTDGLTITGSAVDSNSDIGTLTATRTTSPSVAIPLTPKVRIAIPPVVAVSQRTATIILQKFKNPVFISRRRVKARAGSVRGTVRYDVTIKGQERRRLIATRNRVTVKNLKPGTYAVSFKATALKGGQPVFSSRQSLTTPFSTN